LHVERIELTQPELLAVHDTTPDDFEMDSRPADWIPEDYYAG